MSNKFFNKQFFDGFSKVFKGPQHAGKVATIGGVKPKVKPSEASVKFEKVKKQIDQGLDKGIRDFKTENPGRVVSDDQIKKIRKDKKEEMMAKERKAFLREKKRKGGRIGFKKGTGRSGVPAMDIKTKISLAKKKKKNGKTPFGMLSVKAGIDKNPNPTYADKIAGGKMKNKKKVI